MSFINERVQPEGLTFDDVLLVPAYSEVLPREVNIQTRFSRNIKLNIPIVSAAMDTVTEAPLAIALAREGGIGVIHKNMSIAEQAAQVRRVKRAENGMIYDPVTISKENTVGDALNLMRENKIGGIPVVDDDNILIGIVTNRDLRFQRDMMRRIEEVMTPGDRLITTHSTELSHASEVLLNSKIEKLPVVDDKGHLVGLITYKDITKVQDHPNACKDAKGRLRVAAGVGITPDALERVKALVAEDVDAVVLDSAHGHSIAMVRKLREIKEVYPSLEVIAGNVATAEAARFLIENGADGVKVGIGPGSICTTRIIAGVGVPQLSAIFDAASAAAGTGVPVIADGGLRYSGDLVKALAATGKPIILVLNESRGRAISDIEPLAKAVVHTMLPGNYGGDALAELLAGNENFSGRLPYTYSAQPNAMVNYDYKASEVRETISGVYDYNAKTYEQWWFGAGMSYTTYTYSNLRADKNSFTKDDVLTFTVDVKNTGAMAGKETVMLYASDLYASLMPDNRRLRGFEKIVLAPDESKTVTFRIKASDLAFMGTGKKWTLEAGEFNIACGDQSVNIHCTEDYTWEEENIPDN